MMAWVASLVAVTPQAIWRLAIRSVRNENGTGSSSPACISQAGPVDRAAVQPRRRTGLEAAETQAQRHEPIRQPQRRRLADPSGRDLALAHVDQAAQEGAGGDDDRARLDSLAAGRHDAGDAAVLDDQVAHRPLDHLEVGRGADRRLHGGPVELAVGLGAGALHRRPLRPVQQAELDAGGIGDPAHQAVQRIDLAHQVALAEPADGRIAGHLADGVEAVRYQRRARAHAGSGGRGLTAGMAATDHDDVEVLPGHIRVRTGPELARNLSESGPWRKRLALRMISGDDLWPHCRAYRGL